MTWAYGNGRVSRLLSLFLLYKSGYDVGKYVSFEEQINDSKNFYYDALQESSIGWHTNENSYFEYMKNFLSMLYKYYKDLDKRFFTINGKSLKNRKSWAECFEQRASGLKNRNLWYSSGCESVYSRSRARKNGKDRLCYEIRAGKGNEICQCKIYQ